MLTKVLGNPSGVKKLVPSGIVNLIMPSDDSVSVLAMIVPSAAIDPTMEVTPVSTLPAALPPVVPTPVLPLPPPIVPAPPPPEAVPDPLLLLPPPETVPVLPPPPVIAVTLIALLVVEAKPEAVAVSV
jgi:hypothetical protein